MGYSRPIYSYSHNYGHGPLEFVVIEFPDGVFLLSMSGCATGVLTEAEFAAAKAKLLGRIAT
jgi:hypothetical protein